jgi:crossover junction endodeoxyribonuclease RuvC
MRVLGIDPSLVCTGVGIIDYPNTGRAETVESKGKRAATLTQRDNRIRALADEILAYATINTRLVVIEGPSLGSRGGSPWDRAGLWWRIVAGLLHRDLPVAVIPPLTLKKWAANSGRADKSDVAVAMARMWPAVDAESNDGWDALGLAHIGAQTLGWSVPSRAHHAPALAKVEWPDLPTPIGAAS